MSGEIFKFEIDSRIKEYLNIVVCSDVSNIIISYYTSTWHCRKLEDKYRDVSQQLLFVNDKLISVKKSVEMICPDLIFDSYGNIITSADILKMFVDKSYIYLLGHETLRIVNYQTKHVDNMMMFVNTKINEHRNSSVNVTKNIIPVIRCIKNKIIYTYKLDIQYVDNLDILVSGISEYQLKNIEIYYDICKDNRICNLFSITDINREIHSARDVNVSHLFANNDEFVMSIQDSFLSYDEIRKLKLNVNIDAWCIFSSYYTIISYCDDYQIIYLRYEYTATNLCCINKFDGKIRECAADGHMGVRIGRDSLVTIHRQRSSIYEFK